MKGRSAILAVILLITAPAVFSQNFVYRENTADSEADLIYRNVWGERNLIRGFYIYSPITKNAHEISLDGNFATVKWVNTREDGTVDVYTRAGNRITAEVTRKGRPQTVTREIDDAPWYASMEYGLSQFFRRGEESVEFWNILPDNLKAYKMRAEVLAREIIEVAGEKTDTVKVRVTINGVPALFFHFMYWFRETDGFFVRFEGAKGVPGTPLTTMVYTRTE